MTQLSTKHLQYWESVVENTLIGVNLEHTKEKIAIMQAYVDGKEIEFKPQFSDNWETCKEPVWNWHECSYRVKKKIHYFLCWRSFDGAELFTTNPQTDLKKYEHVKKDIESLGGKVLSEHTVEI